MPEKIIRIRDQRNQKMRELDEQGVPRVEIARQFGVTRQLVTRTLGTLPKSEDNAKEIHVYCNPENFEACREIALELGLTQRGGSNVGRGHVGKLIDAIGSGKITLIPAEEPD